MAFNVKKNLLKANGLVVRGDLAGAEKLYDQILELFPANREAIKKRAELTALRSTGIQLEKGPFQKEIEAVVGLYNRGHLQQAVVQGKRLAARFPQEALVHNLIGAAETGLGSFDSAVGSLQEAIRLMPDYAEAFNNLGAAYNMMEMSFEALSCYTKVVELHPEFAEAYNNRANVLKKTGDFEGALLDYTKAIQIQPNFADAHYNMGALLGHMSRFREGVHSCTLALEIAPGFSVARAARLFQQAKICDWEAIEADAQKIPSLGVEEGYVSPFSLLSFEDMPNQELKRAIRFSQKYYKDRGEGSFLPSKVPNKRIRIGYFSADFHNHATMYLMAGLFECHSRDDFCVHAFSYGAVQDDEMSLRLKDAVEEFHDVRSLGDRQVAELACSQGLDIAIDLKGYTQESRLGIFVNRAAPVQISYLGYPGTLGASFMDYIIADPIVIPARHREQYSEKIIYLPNSYQVNDGDRKVSEVTITRADAGLPDNAFVFCCFNNNYKIGPREFDLWMNLISRCENAVLWLLKSNQEAASALKLEAEKRDISPDRIVFASPLSNQEHLSRLGLADLFLDTFNYNAHTSASDALWAGVPVVTKLGESFSARVAGSLLHAVGLSDLVASSDSEYEEMAFELASQPKRLTGLKSLLRDKKTTAPLFDTRLFALHIEEAYRQVYSNYLDGRDPSDILIEP